MKFKKKQKHGKSSRSNMKKKSKIESEMKAQKDDENFDTAVSLDITTT